MMKMKTLSPTAHDALRSAVIAADGVALTVQLDGKIYKEVNAVMEELGGGWNRKQRRHLFTSDSDWQKYLREVIATGQIAFAKDSGFFPTPASIIEMMIRAAEFQPGEVFLEPNAGRGDVLKAVRNHSAQNNLDLGLFACELNPRFVDELRRDKFLVAAGDFLSFEAVEKADKILMNPPFEANGDIKHGLHAFRHLKIGGRMVIITRADLGRRSRWHDEWDKLCASCRTVSAELPSASFKAAGTLIETRLNVFLKTRADESSFVG